MGEAFAADRKALKLGGYEVNVVLSQPGFVRAIVGKGGEATMVEWAHNSAWRFLPPVPDPVVGFRLQPIDLSINKVLVLAGRDEPRDFLDILFVHRNYLSLGSLCLAAEKRIRAADRRCSWSCWPARAAAHRAVRVDSNPLSVRYF